MLLLAFQFHLKSLFGSIPIHWRKYKKINIIDAGIMLDNKKDITPIITRVYETYNN
jgi:hypothetical protein